MNRLTELALVVLALFAFSCLLNFVWESFHAVYLYEAHDFDAAKYIPMVAYVSGVDGLLVLGMWLFVSIAWKDLLWIKDYSKTQVVIFFIIGLLTASFIEYRAVFLLEKWAYNPSMPTVFGIGLSPMVQLSTTGLLAVWLTNRVLYGESSF